MLDHTGAVALRHKEPSNVIGILSTHSVMLVPVPRSVVNFAKDVGMRVVQINGQRFFGPLVMIQPSWNPPKGTEIFVGKLPRLMTERQLIPLFEQSGQIFQMRLMMDFSGTNKGYCFVKYFHPDQAEFAIRNLNRYEIIPGRCLVAVKSADNCKLLLGGLPTYKSEREIFLEVSYYCYGVERVWKGWTNPAATNKCMVWVTFVSHRAAALARSELLKANLRLWGYKISVDWAEPDTPVEKFFRDKPQVLRVDNVKRQITVRTLFKVFNEGSFNGVTNVIKKGSTAFITFYSRVQAEAAKVAFNNYNLGGRQIDVKWWNPDKPPFPGRPTGHKKLKGSKRPKKNLCITSGKEEPEEANPTLSLEPAAAPVTGKQRKLKVRRRRKNRFHTCNDAPCFKSCCQWKQKKDQLALPSTDDLVCNNAPKEVEKELPAPASPSLVTFKKFSMENISIVCKNAEIACSTIELIQYEELCS